jgi:hypothetical protein
MKTLLLIFFFITFNNFLYAQKEIDKLTVERANLYRKYKETENLTSGYLAIVQKVIYKQLLMP